MLQQPLNQVQSKSDFPFSDCSISIEWQWTIPQVLLKVKVTKISIIWSSRIIFFSYLLHRKSSYNLQDSLCVLITDIQYGLLMTCKLNCWCGYLHWIWGWAPRWGLLELPLFRSFLLHRIYWQSMDEPPGPLYTALDLQEYPMKRINDLMSVCSNDCVVKVTV